MAQHITKAALNSDQAQNCQTLDNDNPITKMVGQRKAARVAVADKGAATAATTEISDRVAAMEKIKQALWGLLPEAFLFIQT